MHQQWYATQFEKNSTDLRFARGGASSFLGLVFHCIFHSNFEFVPFVAKLHTFFSFCNTIVSYCL